MQLEVSPHILKQESVSLETTNLTAVTVIPELALAQGDTMIIPTLVGTKQSTFQTTGTSTSKPWGTSWFSDVCNFVLIFCFLLKENYRQ